MVLILTDRRDPWAMAVEAELRRRGTPVHLVYADSLPSSLQINWVVSGERDVGQSACLINGSEHLDPRDLTGVFVRTSVGRLPLHTPHLDSCDRVYVERETSAALFAWLNALACPVVNRPVPGAHTDLSFFRASMSETLRAAGLHPSPAVVVSHETTALSWYDQWNRHVLARVVGNGRSAILDGQHGRETLRRLVGQSPVVMQPLSTGRLLSVFIIGRIALGAWWEGAGTGSNGIAERLRFEAIDPNLTERGLALAQALQLSFAACQLHLADSGTLTCLDLSDRPQFNHCDEVLRGMIVACLVSILSGRRGEGDDSCVRAHRRSHRGQYLCAAFGQGT